MENRTVKQRKAMINKGSKKLSVRRQSQLLQINRSSLYHASKGESKQNLNLMRLIDKIYLDNPTYGVLRMQDQLRDLGYQLNPKRIRRLMRTIGLEAIYPKRNLSRLGKAKFIHPYLLRDLEISKPNQVWSIDISYIAMEKGFMYLTAIIDIYSRYLLGWKLSNTLDKENQTELLDQCVSKYGKPQIINSDQGSQFTSQHWVETLTQYKIKISMDGKGRAIDNVYIERFFRTIKQDYVYLHPTKDGLELYQGISKYIEKYNHRSHQGIGRVKPIERYNQVV